MSTNSTLSLLHTDGKVSSISIHWSGYLAYNGVMLFQHYKDLNKIHATIDLGNISELRKEILIPCGVLHNFNQPNDNITIFYGRDRGEDNTEKKVYSSLKDFINTTIDSYNYVFDEKDNEWYFINRKGKVQILAEALLNDSSIKESVKQEILLEKEKKQLAENLDNHLDNKTDKLSSKLKI